MSKIINKESQYQQEGATFNLFYLQLSYLGEKRLTSLFQGWSENGKRVDWFYPVTPGRHILEPEDMVPLDAAYDVRLQLAWMNWEYQVDPDSGNYLCYLQTLVSVENGAVQTDKKDQAILEVIGGNTLNWRERIELRYGYVVRIMEKIRRKTGQKGKTKKNSRKELTK